MYKAAKTASIRKILRSPNKWKRYGKPIIEYESRPSSQRLRAKFLYHKAHCQRELRRIQNHWCRNKAEKLQDTDNWNIRLLRNFGSVRKFTSMLKVAANISELTDTQKHFSTLLSPDSTEASHRGVPQHPVRQWNVFPLYHDFEVALKSIRFFRPPGPNNAPWKWSSMKDYLSKNLPPSSSPTDLGKRMKFHQLWKVWISSRCSREEIEDMHHREDPLQDPAQLPSDLEDILPEIQLFQSQQRNHRYVFLHETNLGKVQRAAKNLSNDFLRSWKRVWQCSKSSHVAGPQTL